MPFKRKVNWTQEEITNILEMGKEGATYQDIGNVYGISKERVRQVIHRYIPKWQETCGRAVRKQKKLKLYEETLGVDSINHDLYVVQRLKFSAKKGNARRTGWTWSLSFTDIFWPTHCPVLGMELDYFAEGRQENSPSFDQIDAGKGYVKGNVQIISWRANRIKNDGTAEEHERIASYLRSREP